MYEFEAFIEFGNLVKMDHAEFDSLERMIEINVPRIPMYVVTIKKSNVIKNTAKMVYILFSTH